MTADDSTPYSALERRSGRPPAPLQAEKLKPEWYDLAVWLREMYERSNKTFSELGAKLGVHAATVSRYCSGKAIPQSASWVKDYLDLIGDITGKEISAEEREKGLRLYHMAARRSDDLAVARLSELDQLRDTFTQRVVDAEEYIERLRKKLAAERDRLAASEAEIARLKSTIGHSDELAAKLADAESRLGEEQRRNDERAAQVTRLEVQLDEAIKIAATLREDRDRLAAVAAAAAERDLGTGAGSLIDTDAIFHQFLDLNPARRPRIWGKVPLRAPSFTGREAYLDQLRDRFLPVANKKDVPPLVLHGTNGVGKTHIVTEYIHRHTAHYDVVWWLDAEHPSQIRAGLVDLANRLKLPAGSAELTVPAALEALRLGDPYPRWMLVFDGAFDAESVSPFLPTGFGHVLITSCNPDWASVANVIEVGPFNRDESIDLLRQGLDVGEAEANTLSEALGDLPFAVSQVAVWLTQTGMPIPEFLELMPLRPELLHRINSGEQLPVARIWDVPFARLRHDHPPAFELMRLLAFLGPSPISRDMFVDMGWAAMPDALREVLGNPVGLNDAVRHISRGGLARIDHTSGDISVPRLLQAAIRDQVTGEEANDLRRLAQLLTEARSEGS